MQDQTKLESKWSVNLEREMGRVEKIIEYLNTELKGKLGLKDLDSSIDIL